ncbi:MAG: efflux RND transporter periplasmic adaptor subunit [Elusimicrobiota bacterium]
MNRKIVIIAGLVLLTGSFVGYVMTRGDSSHESRHATKYQCPMHPSYTSDKPGDCPICGMSLVPMEPALAGAPVNDISKSAVSGQAATVISEQKRQLIGMKSEALARRHLKFTVRASGSVASDPEMYNAIAEHHSAMVAHDNVKNSPWPDVHERAEALLRASTLRLRQLGLSEAQIAAYTGMEDVPENLLLGGAGGPVWVYAQIYEYEIASIRPGLDAEITTPAYPGRIFRGTVKTIDPNLSAETRSLRVRIEVPNPGGLLKLEMFVNAAIKADLGVVLALPEGALLDSGARKLVFVDLGEGRIEPREVRVGREADGYHELLSGVKEGEKVVTTANFLIDSESKLKSLR